MQALTIFKERIVYPDTREEHPSIEGLSISKFSEIVLRWSNYGDYLLRTERMALHTSSDYDGSPLEDFYQIRYNVDNSHTISDDPFISIIFESTFDSDYDYTAMASRSTRTAYKRGRPLQPQETKFKIYRVILRRKAGEAETWFKNELIRLKRIFDKLDETTSDLSNWAKSDINMRVFCPTRDCRSYQNPAIIPPSQLLSYSNSGLSLENLKEKLKCKVCGARCCNIKAA